MINSSARDKIIELWARAGFSTETALTPIDLVKMADISIHAIKSEDSLQIDQEQSLSTLQHHSSSEVGKRLTHAQAIILFAIRDLEAKAWAGNILREVNTRWDVNYSQGRIKVTLDRMTSQSLLDRSAPATVETHDGEMRRVAHYSPTVIGVEALQRWIAESSQALRNASLPSITTASR
jgi:DNA-binding MarR family transcriptional regulator